MSTMRHWAAIVTAEHFAAERLYAHDRIDVPAGLGEGIEGATVGDSVVLLAAATPTALVFGRGRVARREADGSVQVDYSARLFDDPPPVPADVPGLSGSADGSGVPVQALAPGLYPLAEAVHVRLSGLLDGPAARGRLNWLVSVALPIEATSRAEAVREFWTYVQKLGPVELPAYVWPLGDELAMQPFVLGALANQDPEEDDDD